MRKLLIEIAEYAPRSVENLLAVSGVFAFICNFFNIRATGAGTLTVRITGTLRGSISEIDTDKE